MTTARPVLRMGVAHPVVAMPGAAVRLRDPVQAPADRLNAVVLRADRHPGVPHERLAIGS